jgi:hypothetical protein
MPPATSKKIFYHLFTTILFLYDSLFELFSQENAAK